MSFSFQSGRINDRIPALCAAMTLSLMPAHGKDLASQRDLPGHGQAGFHFPVGDQGGKRCQHGHPGRGAVLGNGPFGDVNMDIMGIKKSVIHSQPAAVGPDKA